MSSRNWTQEQLDAHLKRTLGTTAKSIVTAGEAAERESALHNDIIDECRRRGWIYFHGSMAHRTRRTKAEPDFTILTDLPQVFAGSDLARPVTPRTLYIECKSRTGKRTPEQLALAAHAKKLGHTIHLIQSIEEFHQLIAS